MTRRCPHCGDEIRKPAARFCPTCGRTLAETEPPTRNAWLIVAVPGQPVREIPLDRPSLTVGRAPDNDVVLPLDHISSHHGRLDCQPDGTWRYTDLESTNGSFLQGQRVRRVILQDGDGLLLGGPPTSAVHLTFRIGDATTRRCPRCGAINREDARFCRMCRASLLPVDATRSVAGPPCPRCGAANRMDARFCRACGASLRAPVLAVPPSPPPMPPVEKAPRPVAGPPPGPRSRQHRAFPWGIAAAGVLGLLCLLGAVMAVSGLIGRERASFAPIVEVPPTTPAPSPPAPGRLPSNPVTKPLYGYVHPTAGYGFNYPADWEGYVEQNDVIFLLPTGARVRVYVEPALPGETLEAYIEQANRFPPVTVLETWETALGGEFAICQKVAYAGEDRLWTCACLAIHRDRIYVASLTALDALPEAQQQASLDEFFVLLRSFVLQ